MPGEAVRLLGRFGRRYAAVVRVATLVPIGAIALLRASPEAFAATAVTVAVAVGWTVSHAWWLDRRAAGPWLVAVDVAVLVGVCASVFVTDAVDETNTGWLRLLVTFACVTIQWHTTPLVGAVAVVVAGGGALAVVAAAGASPSVLRGQIWVLAAAALSRAAWVLVTRAARRADRMTARAAEASRAAAVADAERAEERELANSLHDTAATTLLMVGTGQVPPGAAWLAPQARRDLDRLRFDGGPEPERIDLVDLLRADLAATHLTVALDAPPRLPLPCAVAGALAGATTEALNNVRRHAGTDRAEVLVRGDEQALRVDIVDDGRGFTVGDGPPASRRGLRESVHGRMSRVGGTATITSAEGAGTVVRLDWRAERA